MVAINKNKAISTTLKWEGGYTDHPKDPGGPTNFGITIADAIVTGKQIGRAHV